MKTPFDAGGAALGRAIVSTVSEAIALAQIHPKRLAAIGIGSPGPLDLRRGIILRTPNIGVRNLKIRALLSQTFAVPVFLDNDVHMALWGEFRAGAGRGYRDLAGLWVGTGIGGAIIVDGRLVHGSNQNAGEIGHIVLDARDAAPGQAGGTLEAEASKSAIARVLRLGRDAKGSSERLDSSDLAAAFREGDPLARRAVERSARYVGIAIANLFNLLAPEIFILGGGVVEDLGRPYLARVRKSAREFAFSTELADIRIVAAALKADAGVIGAARTARECVMA
jgi:glucokinase